MKFISSVLERSHAHENLIPYISLPMLCKITKLIYVLYLGKEICSCT